MGGTLKKVLDSPFSVQVNWDRSLEDKTAELQRRKFFFINPELTSAHFPNPNGRGGQEKIKLVIPTFGKSLTTDQAKQCLREAALTGSHPQILLDWLLQYQNKLESGLMSSLIQKLLVVVLEVAWQDPYGYDRVVGVCYYASKWQLSLQSLATDWSGSWRFAGQKI